MIYKNKEDFYSFIHGKISELQTYKFNIPEINESGVILNGNKIFIHRDKYELIEITIAFYKGMYYTGHHFEYSQGACSGGVSIQQGYDTIELAIEKEIQRLSKFTLRGYYENLYSPTLKNIVKFAGSYSRELKSLQTLF